jgi:hypothetical protein
MTATYKNTATKEVYELGGVKGISHAWQLANTVCDRTNWNFDVFHIDVKVSVK